MVGGVPVGGRSNPFHAGLRVVGSRAGPSPPTANTGLGLTGVGWGTVDHLRIAVIGDRIPNFAPHDAIETSLGHSAARMGASVEVTWYPTPTLAPPAGELAADDVPAEEVLADADAVWCAPGSPFASLSGALAGIRFAREHRRPFLGTCAGFQHGVIEIARNVLGIADAAHAEYGDDLDRGPLFIDELLCSLAGQIMTVDIVDPRLRDCYGADRTEERYYCRFGLNETYLPQLAAAGLTVAGTDPADGGTRILRLDGHPFFYLTLFVPQTSSTPDRPHPLVTTYLTAATLAHRPGGSVTR
jgi:CTP synthase (UTP-ammonia lyase)